MRTLRHLAIGAAMMCLATGAATQAATSGYWRAEADLNAGGGLTVANEVAGGNTLTSSGASVDTANVPVAFIPNTGAANLGSFNGSPNLNASVTAYPALDSGSITVEFWARTVEGLGDFISRTNNTSAGFKMTGFNGLQVNYYVDDGLGGSQSVAINTTYDMGSAWDHIAWSYDQASGLGRVFVNGKQVGESASATAGQALIWTGAGNLSVGNDMDGGSLSSASTAGYFDELRISDTALPTHQLLVAPGLAVDFGATGQTVQTMFQEFTQSTSSASVSRTYDSPYGNAGQVTVTAAADNGVGAIDFRTRTNVTDELGDLLEDHIKNQIGGVELTLTDLAAGAYVMTSWHHEGQAGLATGGGGQNHFSVDVSDALGDRSIADDLIISGGITDVDPTTLQYTIFSDGINPVVVTIGALGIGPAGDSSVNEINLNGFQLVAIPEPAALALLIPAFAAIRRR